jgi:hypothetical protein
MQEVPGNTRVVRLRRVAPLRINCPTGEDSNRKKAFKNRDFWRLGRRWVKNGTTVFIFARSAP